MNLLEKFAAQIRLETLKMLDHRGFGHLGGALSIVEVLAVLYGKHMHVNPNDPSDPHRDYFVLSKGHGGPSYYATLALKGFFDKAILNTLNDDGTTLPSHPDRLSIPGVDATTGSLGQGISLAVGIAKGLAMSAKANKVYVVVGDGECNEGQVWEAISFVAHHGLDNLIIFIDENKKQLDGLTKDILDPFDLAKKVEAFGLHVLRVDGSDVNAISDAIDQCHTLKNKTSCIVLETTKGQGVPYFEALDDNHHVRFDEHGKTMLHQAIDALEKQLMGGQHE